ncbi:MAG: tRNA (N6-threonylcarbamoyladenosine(37)-N6)-methyltransferase TrmO [Dorea sp.]|nr:tRNA (N6-threonylcarbamoyladenosine(37)-N6)-methyltransferase TrmO [Dorea sp.]
MRDELLLKKIAVIRTDFPEKFGIPRQSGLADAEGRIVFEPEYRNPDALRGIEAYSHLWIIWGFSQVPEREWQPMVRPPRLGGNQRMGVFATRSPFRPNPVGLSLAELVSVEQSRNQGTVLCVRGVDMLDGTPVYDIKPYLPCVEAREGAADGFAGRVKDRRLLVEIPDEQLRMVPQDKRRILEELLMQDPRPAYQVDPDRVYGMTYAGMEIKFQVRGDRLKVCGIYEKVH